LIEISFKTTQQKSHSDFLLIGYATMNITQIKCLLVFSIFAVIGFGPISPTCLIGMYIVVMRPLWFFNLVSNLYDNPSDFQTKLSNNPGRQAVQARIKCFLSLLTIFIIDIAPIPVASLFAFTVVLGRPKWFQSVVANVYGIA